MYPRCFMYAILKVHFNFSLKSGMVFVELWVEFEHIRCFNSKWIRKKDNMRIRNGLKGLVYRLSYVCQFIDHGISTARCNSPPSDTVNLLLVIGVSRTSLIVGGFRYYQRRKLIPQPSVVLVIDHLPSKLAFFHQTMEAGPAVMEVLELPQGQPVKIIMG